VALAKHAARIRKTRDRDHSDGMNAAPKSPHGGTVRRKRETDMNNRETNENRELSSEEVNAVSGGWFAAEHASFSRSNETSGSGQNDPAQMFQQILQQLTQG
jgi:hypothetical protein